MNTKAILHEAASKMQSARLSEASISAFTHALSRLVSGERGMLAESSLGDLTSVPALTSLPPASPNSSTLLSQLVVIKLNGGLGTSMGLESAKSLIQVRRGDTFLDLTARQILHWRQSTRSSTPAFYLMNSFSTQEDSLSYLRKHQPQLWSNSSDSIDFLQGKVPKLDATSFLPVAWPADPSLEWCPPGHGDIYPSLLGSGLLDQWLRQGLRYAFVSNSDNLGATIDLRILSAFAQNGQSFLMEVAERTPADRKGGHLARRKSDQRLVLREAAQCAAEDREAFQDIQKHRYFNTNNLWLRLDHLKEELTRQGGLLPLPLITNQKTVDPKLPSSPKVIQLETAMGAAIECFPSTGALVVDRQRFAPVKTTADLLAVRSDAYEVTPDHTLQLIASRRGVPPVIELDERHYKTIAPFEELLGTNIPSLASCLHLRIHGPITFDPGVVCSGKVEFINNTTTPRRVAAGRYHEQTVHVE